MALRPVPREDDWPAEIAEAASAEFWCTIDVFLPGAKGAFDPKTDTRAPDSPDTLLITARAARAQHLRSPLESFGAYERNVRRAYRFQFLPATGDPAIPDGAVVRVTATKRSDSSITKYTYQVSNAANSDHDAIVTLECTSEFGVTA